MKKLIVVLVVLFALVAAAGHLLSPDYTVSRSIVINAPTAKVHEYVGELTNSDAWAPWRDKEMGGDPTIKLNFGPTTTGVGAHESWVAENGDGGELTFTKCDSETGIAYDMAFTQGGERYPSTSTTTYKPVNGGTEVTWSMQGSMDMPVLGGVLKLGPLMLPFMKSSIGGMFEKGLAKLKKVAEAGA